MSELAKWANPASTVLLLGAGVSVPSGAPTWHELRDRLVAGLRPDLTVDGELPLIAEVLEREVGRRRLIEETARILDLEPAGGITVLPKYPWRAIYTTNFDRLVELAADACGASYSVIRSRFDLPDLDDRSRLPIFKLHGCVSQDRAFGSPSSLILTKSDYRSVRAWKTDLLRRMQTDMESGKILIIGQSLSDPHLDELIEEIVSLQEEIGFRNKAAILLFDAPPEIQDMFEARGISVTVGDFDWFVSELANVEHDDTARPIASSVDEEPLLDDALQSITIDVDHAVRLESPARKMFSGAPATYFDIAHNRTFARDAVDELMTRLSRDNVAVLVGPAGFGKTTMARQVGLLRRDLGIRVWEHRPDLPLDVSAWARVNRRLVDSGQTGLLILDNVTTYQRSVNELMRVLGKAETLALEVLVTAEHHRWKRLNKHPMLVKRDPLTPHRLSNAEITRLIDLAITSAEIRSVIPSFYLAWSEGQQRQYLKRQCSADIFICLRNIFASTGFDTIVLEEFANLEGDLQEVYKLVSALEALCGGSHRQLVLRMLDLDYHRIGEVLEDLSGLMAETSMSVADGIYVWRTRHPEIADIVTRYKYANPDEHVQLIRDVVDSLRPTVDIEKNAIRGLCNSELGLDFIQDDAARLEIIESLVQKLPQDHVLRHRLVREFVRFGTPAEAEQVLETSIVDVGLDPPLLRYRIELHRLRAQAEGLMSEDREALLRWAWAGCQTAMDRFSDNWFTYRSVAEVAIDWFEFNGDRSLLEVAKVELRAARDRLFEPQLEKYRSRVEACIIG